MDEKKTGMGLYRGMTGYVHQYDSYKDEGPNARTGMDSAIGAFGQVIAFLPSRNIVIAVKSNKLRLSISLKAWTILCRTNAVFDRFQLAIPF